MLLAFLSCHVSRTLIEANTGFTLLFHYIESTFFCIYYVNEWIITWHSSEICPYTNQKIKVLNVQQRSVRYKKKAKYENKRQSHSSYMVLPCLRSWVYKRAFAIDNCRRLSPGTRYPDFPAPSHHKNSFTRTEFVQKLPWIWPLLTKWCTTLKNKSTISDIKSLIYLW